MYSRHLLVWLHITAYDKAEALNHCFKSVLQLKIYTAYVPILPDSPYPLTVNISITNKGVYSLQLLSKLVNWIHKKQNFNGLDNIPTHILKETAFEITPMLTHLFQQSLDSSEIPQDWKSALVTPIYKKGK